jgi:hypothetical protein
MISYLGCIIRMVWLYPSGVYNVYKQRLHGHLFCKVKQFVYGHFGKA